MIDCAKIRKWATPLTIGAFALSAVSGIMMFFHVNSPLIKVLHEWGSWFLVFGGLCHIAGSWELFVRYFSRPAARVIMAVFAILIIMFFIPLGGTTGNHARNGRRLPPAIISRALPDTSLAVIAGVAQHRPEELIKELESKGITIRDREETIREIAESNKKENVEILNVIF